MCSFSYSSTKTALTALSVAATYKSNSAPGVGVARVFGFDMYIFISSNASCYFLFLCVLEISADFALLILK